MKITSTCSTKAENSQQAELWPLGRYAGPLVHCYRCCSACTELAAMTDRGPLYYCCLHVVLSTVAHRPAGGLLTVALFTTLIVLCRTVRSLQERFIFKSSRFALIHLVLRYPYRRLTKNQETFFLYVFGTPCLTHLSWHVLKPLGLPASPARRTSEDDLGCRRVQRTRASSAVQEVSEPLLLQSGKRRKHSGGLL